MNQTNDEDTFNFHSIANSSPYFWYPPIANLKAHSEKLEKSSKTNSNTNNQANNTSTITIATSA